VRALAEQCPDVTAVMTYPFVVKPVVLSVSRTPVVV
jgi:hypothetical protein